MPSGLTHFELESDLSPKLGANFEVTGYSIVTTADGNISLGPDGTGGVYISSNLGVGTGPSDDRININYAPADDTAAYGIKLLYTPSTTIDAAQAYRALSMASSPSISAGKTNSSSSHGLFTSILGAAGFQGNLNIMQGHENRYGFSSGAGGTITTCYGLRLTPYIQAGTIDNLFNIHIDSEAAGGTITNTYYSIKDLSTGHWWLALDNKELCLGASANFKMSYDGTDLQFTISSGDYVFNDGAIDFIGADAGLICGEISAVGNAVETAIGVAGTAVQILIFDTDGPSNQTTPAHAQDHITIIKTGVYFIAVSATVNSVAAGAASKFEMTVQKNDGAALVGALHCDRNLGGGGIETGVISMSGIAILTANDTIEVWIENETNTDNYVIEDITLSLFKIGGTS